MPAGSVRFMHEDPTALSRYRFGHKTADFVFCGRCGGYLGAVTEEEGQALMVINLRALDPQPEGLPAAQPMSYEGRDERGPQLRAGRRGGLPSAGRTNELGPPGISMKPLQER